MFVRMYSNRFLITFGNPEFSVWRFAAQSNLTLWYHDPVSVSKLQLELDPFYKSDGSFMLTGGRHHGIFATTDAHVSFYVQTRARSLMVSFLISTYIYLLAYRQILTHISETPLKCDYESDYGGLSQGFICLYDAHTVEQVAAPVSTSRK
jgi:hypothetical protein